jgi:fumarylacetoacetate (FAA) hydrolase family protein
MKKRKYIHFNLLKIELKITSQKHKNLEGKKQNSEMKRRKNELKGRSLGFIAKFYRRTFK